MAVPGHGTYCQYFQSLALPVFCFLGCSEPDLTCFISWVSSGCLHPLPKPPAGSWVLLTLHTLWVSTALCPAGVSLSPCPRSGILPKPQTRDSSLLLRDCHVDSSSPRRPFAMPLQVCDMSPDQAFPFCSTPPTLWLTSFPL